MPSTALRVYWDSCAWIALLNKEQDKVIALQAFWDAASTKGKYEIWTSVYSYLEVIHGKNEIGCAYPPEEYDQKVNDMFDQPHVERVQLDVEVAKLARALKRKYHPTLSKRSDAIHLATALYWNCEELHTYDGSDLLPFDGVIQRRDGKPLPIKAPGREPPGPLFDTIHPDEAAPEAVASEQEVSTPTETPLSEEEIDAIVAELNVDPIDSIDETKNGID